MVGPHLENIGTFVLVPYWVWCLVDFLNTPGKHRNLVPVFFEGNCWWFCWILGVSISWTFRKKRRTLRNSFPGTVLLLKGVILWGESFCRAVYNNCYFMEKTTLEMNTDLFDQQFQGRQFVSNGRVGLTSRVWDYWMDQYRTIPPSFSLYFGASNSWIPNLMVLRTRTGSILGCPWNLVTILSMLGCNLLRGLTTYLYRAYNLFTKFHGHPSTAVAFWFNQSTHSFPQPPGGRGACPA